MKYLHHGRRVSGMVVPLSAIRTPASTGCGEFPDLAVLGGLAKTWDFELVQLLPVQDSGMENSPYGALSAFALNPVYLGIDSLPELRSGSADAIDRAVREEVLGRTAGLRIMYGDDPILRYRPGAYSESVARRSRR